MAKSEKLNNQDFVWFDDIDDIKADFDEGDCDPFKDIDAFFKEVDSLFDGMNSDIDPYDESGGDIVG